MKILQIVSRLPPAIDGVGDYAFLLAKQLRLAHDIHTTFVVCDPQSENAETLKSEILKSEIDGFKVHQLKERGVGELLRVLSLPGMPSTVLLQYVGYGYEKRGCPVWLVNALRAWQKSEVRSQKSAPTSVIRPPSSALRHLVTMFHELYAFGPPWRSSFWTSPVQRWITKSLARMSGHCFTNRVASAIWLASARQNAINVISVPVFSNVGEPKQLPDWNERKPQMLIYGALSRNRSDCKLAIEAICKARQTFQIESVIAFGKKSVDSAAGLPVKNVGSLSAIKMATLLLESRVGYVDYSDGCLAKSGIFAAYCAHGLVPLLLQNNHSQADGLEANKHFLVAVNLPASVDVTQQNRISQLAYEWYQKHSIKKTGDKIAAELFKNHVKTFLEV